MKKAVLKVEKGVIELEFTIINNEIADVHITGDFFIYPEEALEKIEESLNSIEANETKIREAFTNIYEKLQLITPGITIENWVDVFLKAMES